jgi:hypothetical protein
LPPRPAGQIEAAGDHLFFTVEMLEQRYQFIPLDKYASGVVPEELAERFIATIIGAVAPWLRLLGFFTDGPTQF